MYIPALLRPPSEEMLLKKYPDPVSKCTIKASSRAQSLILLNANALKALLSVVILTVQKLISRKEVIPINSQPSSNVNHEPANTRSTIDNSKAFSKPRKFNTLRSNLI